jgi:transcription elongation factor Elf1
MRIKKITHQHRRDFTAIFECEGCNETITRSGYDDRNFHDNVIPIIECKNCGKSRNDLGVSGEMTTTRYPEGMNV